MLWYNKYICVWYPQMNILAHVEGETVQWYFKNKSLLNIKLPKLIPGAVKETCLKHVHLSMYSDAWDTTSFMLTKRMSHLSYIYGVVQERRNSSALAMELCLSRTKPSIFTKLTCILWVEFVANKDEISEMRDWYLLEKLWGIIFLGSKKMLHD